MPDVSDDDLMAWVDGELPPAAAERVAAAVAADAGLAARAARLRTLNAQLRQAFAADLSEPVPDALAAVARGEHLAAPDGRAQLLPLAARRHGLAGPLRRVAAWASWATWGGLAAALALAAVLLPRLDPAPGAADPTVQAQADGRLQARGALADALEHGLSGEAHADGTRLLLSFRDRSGAFCRSFAAPAGRGLACREGGQWQVVVLTAPPAPTPSAPTESLRLASADLPAAVLAAIDQRMAGLALDAREERAARDAAWAP